MIALDTDHLSELAFRRRSGHSKLISRMDSSEDRDFRAPIVAAEEQMRGWLADLHRIANVYDQIRGHEILQVCFEFYGHFRLLPFDRRAADQFMELRKRRIRIGTMDLKIAAIALANDVLLLSRNLRDFGRVPGLRVECWLES